MEHSPSVRSGHFAAATEFLLQESQFSQRQAPLLHVESLPFYVQPAKLFGLNEFQHLDGSDFALHGDDLHNLLNDSSSPSDHESKDYIDYSSSLNQSMGFSNSYGAKHSSELSVNECLTPKDLLEVLFFTQQKVQNLETFVQLMAQSGSRRFTPQHHQSLTKNIATITSQLLAATTSFLQHQMPSSLNAHSFVSQQGQILDARLNGLHCNNSPHASSISSHEDILRGIKTSGSIGDVVEVLEISRESARMDLQLKEQIEAYSSVYANNCLPSKKILDNATKDSAFRHNTTLCNTITDAGSISGTEVGNGHHVKSRTGNPTQAFAEDYDLANFHRDVEDEVEGEILPPGSYELIDMAPDEILAENTHFCDFCGKGFKRDANLRMHMRGHGDEYKSPAALSRPDKTVNHSTVLKLRRYSCPHKGCKRNKNHQMFQPLKTMLCIKNHYKRSHCPKLLTCYICKTKKFSVVADLKTHQKHCGKDKWQCSCGTTFSRKDKLMSHLGLFAGHTAAAALQVLEQSVTGVHIPQSTCPSETSNMAM